MRMLGKMRKSTMTLLFIIVAAIIVIPMIMSQLKLRAGFVDIGESITLPSAPKPMANFGSQFLPCRSDGSGQPCPEGTFCDGSSKGCVRIAQPGV